LDLNFISFSYIFEMESNFLDEVSVIKSLLSSVEGF